MTTLRIYDECNGVLALGLSDLVDLLAPRSLEADWTVSPVGIVDQHAGRSHEFMVVGPDQPGNADPLEVLAASQSPVGGVAFSQAANAADQVIWGQFVARLPDQGEAWVDIRAIDSTFLEVTTSDEAVLAAIRAAFEDVRVAPGPTASTPIPWV